MRDTVDAPVRFKSVPRCRDWLAWVNAQQTEAELQRLRQSVVRGRPFGGEAWTKATAAALGLQFALGPRGRSPKRPPPQSDTGPDLFCEK